jgi:magnesium-transporting ATPase (P-type)
LVLLSSSEENGSCYVQTSNIDGETDLKPRQASSPTASFTPEDLSQMRGSISCPVPNSHIYSFDATLQIHTGSTGEPLHSLSAKQLLLQGTVLRNTAYVFGVVVYTGNETKIGMNKTKPKTKWTKLDQLVDRYVLPKIAQLIRLFL